MAGIEIDFGQVLTGFDGEPLLDGATQKPATVGKVCINALMTELDSDKNATGEQKLERGLLARRIYGASEPLAVTPEELVMIRDRVGKGYGPVIVVPAFELLGGHE